MPNFSIKCYDFHTQKKGTLFEPYSFKYTEKSGVKFRADHFRYLILHKYGGLYFDLDVIMIRDLSCFLGIEFCYRWSNSNFGNNAIIHIRKGSPTSIEIMKKSIQFKIKLKNRQEKTGDSLKFVFHKNNLPELHLLPSPKFDPVWKIFDYNLKSTKTKMENFDDFFKTTNEKISLDTFCKGIYAYHWHNRFDIQPQSNSYFNQLTIDINAKFNEKFNNKSN